MGRDGKRFLINAFLVFHLAAILSWAIPVDSLLRRAVEDAVRPYMLWSGLFQSWNMFAPDPLRINTYLEAEVTLTNGETRIWKFPRMSQLGLFDRYVKERYRKWAADNVRLDANSALWPDVARYIARTYANAPAPPQFVKLVRYWSDIPAPGAGGNPPLNRFVFFAYIVRPGDLQ